MSAPEDITSTGSGNRTDSEPPEKRNGAGGTIFLFFIVGFAVSLVVGWVAFPKLLYSQKRQPIDFNHALHVELVEEGCRSCHYFREDGSFSGAPGLAECIDCHTSVNGADPEEEKFVTRYVATGKEVPWLIYAKQPPCVFFSHAAHVNAAKMNCTACHGHIGESTELPVYEENRITGYSRNIWGKSIAGLKENSWDRMKMDDCAECHAKKAPFGTEVPAEDSVFRQFKETAAVAFPSAGIADRGSSVQTEKDACFVCHK